MTNLVSRLRAAPPFDPDSRSKGDSIYQLCATAADEIDRLRTALQHIVDIGNDPDNQPPCYEHKVAADALASSPVEPSVTVPETAGGILTPELEAEVKRELEAAGLVYGGVHEDEPPALTDDDCLALALAICDLEADTLQIEFRERAPKFVRDWLTARTTGNLRSQR